MLNVNMLFSRTLIRVVIGSVFNITFFSLCVIFPYENEIKIKYLEGVLQQAHEYAAEPLAIQCETNRKEIRQGEGKQVSTD